MQNTEDCGNETKDEGKGPKSISTVPPGPMKCSPLPRIINPDLGAALYGSTAPTASRWSLSVFFFLLPFHFVHPEHGTCWRKQNMAYISARGREGSCKEAKLPPIQRMLITCVLSQAEPGHPLWIKREIVSPSLIFHHPEMFGCSCSSGSCAREIIQTHSEQWYPSFLGCWTTSPWILGGHQWP